MWLKGKSSQIKVDIEEKLAKYFEVNSQIEK
jgi:hypothetical protein